MSPAWSHPPIPPLWSNDQAQITDNGFVIVKADSGLLLDSNQPQPLLLRSAELFLKELYPSRPLSEVLDGFPEPLSLQEPPALALVIQDPTVGDTALPVDHSPLRDVESMDVDSESDEEIKNVAPTEKDPGHDDDKTPEDPNFETYHSNNPIDAHMEMESLESDCDASEEENSVAKTPTQKKRTMGITYQKVYQKLKRCHNMGQRIQQVISDIQSFRHRSIQLEKKNADRLTREQAKVRALEKQQQHLLRAKTASSSGTETAKSSQNHQQHCNNDNHNSPEQEETGDVVDLEEDDTNDALAPEEPHIVRMVRTINSIRAVYPHLMQIFNHKRRNDRHLKIGSVQLTNKKRGSCWILGSHVFDVVSTRALINAYKDSTFLLAAYIPWDLAEQIINDSMGGPIEFWSKSWIDELQARSTPNLADPLTILTDYSESLHRQAILEMSQECDKVLHADNPLTDSTHINQKHAQYEAAVTKLHQIISKLLKERFPDSRVSIYGSCLSNLSLGKGADVDLSLWLPKAARLQSDFHEGKIEANQYEKQMKTFVYQVFHKLSNRGQEFQKVMPVTRARVPVVSGLYKFAHNPYTIDGSIHFDICFLNDIAVANSGLLREYSLIDTRVRNLMMGVKLWAKEHQINSAKDNYISSYAWINLVIFYLQCIGFVPNLQCPALMEAVGFRPDPKGNIWHRVKELDTWYLTWDQVQKQKAWTQPSHLSELTVSLLLYGFFEFYSRRFPVGTYAVAIKEGVIKKLKIQSKKARLFISIEDPFETFDSHCPHDLSVPISENGTRDVLQYFRTAERHLRHILLGTQSNKGKLWPEFTRASDQPLDNSQMMPNFKRFDNDVEHGKGASGKGSNRRNRGRRGGRGSKLTTQNSTSDGKEQISSMGQTGEASSVDQKVDASENTKKSKKHTKDEHVDKEGKSNTNRKHNVKRNPGGGNAPYLGKAKSTPTIVPTPGKDDRRNRGDTKGETKVVEHVDNGSRSDEPTNTKELEGGSSIQKRRPRKRRGKNVQQASAS